MPRSRQITETYTGVCWWGPIAHPCKRTRTVTVWDYYFAWLCIDHGFFGYATFTGCENGDKYQWHEWTWLSGGVLRGVPWTLRDQASRVGNCNPESVPLRPDKC